MPEQFTERVEILNSSSGDPTIILNGGDDENGGTIIAGGGGEDGELILLDQSSRQRISLDGNTAAINLQIEDGGISVSIDGARGDITAGGRGVDGDIVLKGADSFLQDRIRLDAGSANVWIGGNDRDGDLLLFDRAGDNRTTGKATIHLSGDEGNVRTRSLSLGSTSGASTFLTGSGGSLFIATPGAFFPTILLNAQHSSMQVGNIHLDGDAVRIVSRSIQLQNAAGANSIFLGGENSTILLGNTLRLDGNAGDIILQNADCAEEFDVLEEVEPGTVMVLDAEGKLRQSTDAYDKRVAGVISGAGNYKPGIVLDRQQSSNTRMPVALMGKVYCKVDAQYGAIEVGDLLTTSPSHGCAMKVDDPIKAFGSVIGKALQGHNQGQGLIPILVCLQ